MRRFQAPKTHLQKGLEYQSSIFLHYYFGWFPKNQPSYYRPIDPMRLEGVFFVESLWCKMFRSMTCFFCFQDAMPECAKERKLNRLPLWVIPWGYPPPTNSEIIICSFLWRAPYKPWLPTVGGPGIPPSHTWSLSTWRDSTWINGKMADLGSLNGTSPNMDGFNGKTAVEPLIPLIRTLKSLSKEFCVGNRMI